MIHQSFIRAMSNILSESASASSLVTNSEIVEFEEIQQKLDKWTIPKVEPKTIYKIGTFDFKTRTVIKTVESNFNLNYQDESRNLLHASDLLHFYKKYKYLHIGLVQIALKPLTLLGNDTCLTLTLRDGRCLDWQQSLMGTIETSLSHGPVYFDVYPNLTVAMDDQHILDTLNIRILTKGYNYKPGSKPISVIYRIYFKVLTTHSPYVRKKSNTGETVLFETNLYSTNVSVPKRIQWKEISFPDTWVLNHAVPPNPEVHHDINNVIQKKEGDIFLSFRKPPSLLRSNSASSSNPLPYQVHYPTSSRNSVDSRMNTESVPEVVGLKVSNQQIPHGIYNESERTNNRDSPTPSEMDFRY